MIRRAAPLFLLALLLSPPAHAAPGDADYQKGEAHFVSGKDYPAAKKAFLKAAEHGNGKAQLRLGFLCAEGHFEGLKPDLKCAERWFTAAAEQNAGDARFRLGNFYANYKKPRDDAKAFLWLKRASDGGHKTAMYDLARLYMDGRGTPKNDAAAFDWMQKSAGAGVLPAMQAISEMYEKGTHGAPRNPLIAAKWILRIATSSTASVSALNRAGDMLAEGKNGVPQNLPAARRYYERAAQKGDTRAKAQLAKIKP
jgi:uncharacterized protein